MADNRPPDYKLRLKRLEERYEQEKAQRKEKERKLSERRKRESGIWKRRNGTEQREKHLDRRRQAEERNRQTSFTELLQHCHGLLCLRLRVERPSRSTTGKIPLPSEKFPLSLFVEIYRVDR
jgi:hypothetical protein